MKRLIIILLFPIYISSNTNVKFNVKYYSHYNNLDYSKLSNSIKSNYNLIELESTECIDVYDFCNGQIDNKYELIEALIWVESSGIDSSYHAGEDAIGCLQIRPIMIREVNRIGKIYNLKNDYSHSDAWDRLKSISIFERWSSVHHNEYDFETMARNWNGGPNGINKEATLVYWDKVLKYASKNL